MVPAPERIATPRLVLRRPTAADAEAIFGGFASDPEATRFMSWRTHGTIDDTRVFLVFAGTAWEREGVGTYLIEKDGRVIGSSGLHPDAAGRAETGYILRRDCWGNGFATETCAAMVELAARLGFARVQAHCFVEHEASARVLEKSGMAFEGVLRKHTLLPNLSAARSDMRLFARVW